MIVIFLSLSLPFCSLASNSVISNNNNIHQKASEKETITSILGKKNNDQNTC